MSQIVIKVEGLSKQYRIGGRQQRNRTLRDTLANTFLSPFRRANKLIRGQAAGAANQDATIWSLKDVSFEVGCGEVVGIIGRNGAGKSTLLKILSLITEPTQGYARVRGRVGSLLEVGTGFHSELTGRENIYLNGAILGMKKTEIDRKFDEIVAFSEIQKFLDTPVKHYSSGMYLRLAFAVAAHLEPDILLVDEVLAVGDVAFQKKCLGKMRDVTKEGRTVLFVSHNMAAIQQLCSTALFFQEGELIGNGKVEDCIDRYLHIGTERLGSILDHVSYNNEGISLQTVTVNGSSSDTQYLPPNCTQLDIEVSGWIERPIRLVIEARVYDQREQCLAFFTPRQTREHFEVLPKGPFHLTESIALPHINKGEYFLGLYIAEFGSSGINPVHIHKAVHLRAEGRPTISGWVFEYARGNGWMLLPPAG